MTLLEHLKQRGTTVADFAAGLQEAENTIRKIAYGQRQPSLPLAIKISEASHGAVTPADLIIVRAPEPASQQAAA